MLEGGEGGSFQLESIKHGRGVARRVCVSLARSPSLSLALAWRATSETPLAKSNAI